MERLKFLMVVSIVFVMVSCDPNDCGLLNDCGSGDPSDTTGMNIDTTVGMYFPPIDQDEWVTQSPESLDWDQSELNDLLVYLEEKNTKGFIILKDGRIVVEEYFNNHSMNKNWQWYSAAKSLTSTMVGIAQEEGKLSLNDKTSVHLGDNWSSLSLEKQDLITVENHITMTTGLKSKVDDFLQWSCTLPFCLEYEVDAGTRWAYHQGAFTLTQDIITKATGTNFKQYCREKIQNRIGMNGEWKALLELNIFSSTTRSMARFGLLALNQGIWDGETIYPKPYHEAMIKPSQDLNKSYGYLWWLNGQGSFLGTIDQTIFNFSLIPNAPSDMYGALGASDQKIYVVPSKNMVVVRCGEAAGNTEFANTSFDNELWGKINDVIN